jgi:hypothetical protein
MPNAKRNRRTRSRREPESTGIPACAVWMLRELGPMLSRLKPPRSRSTKHLRNAAIEFLEAMRALLDETIEWLRKEGRSEAELKRIHVT